MHDTLTPGSRSAGHSNVLDKWHTWTQSIITRSLSRKINGI